MIGYFNRDHNLLEPWRCYHLLVSRCFRLTTYNINLTRYETAPVIVISQIYTTVATESTGRK